MSDITIPPKALEAAALAIFKVRLAERPYPHSPQLIDWLIDVARQEATSALRAGIAAWPGSEPLRRKNGQGKGVFLPFPKENAND